jgi:hypothetical protein
MKNWLERFMPYHWQRLRRWLGLMHQQTFYTKDAKGNLIVVVTDSVPVTSVTDRAGNTFHRL